MTRSTRRGPWLPEEDGTLLQLVRSQGPNNWVRISQHMQHRSPKQCRERYHQNLKPTLNHEPISPDEGELIEQLVQEMGKRWAEIARRLGNRSDNAVKNWWNGSMNRRKRHIVQQPSGSRTVGHRSQPIPATRLPRTDFLHSPHSNQEGFQRQPLPGPPPMHASCPGTDEYDSLRLPAYIPELHLSHHRRTQGQGQLPPSSSFQPSLFPPTDSQPPTLHHQSASAPGSLHATPDPFSFRRLRENAQQNSQSLRAPPLESRPSYHLDWSLPRINSMPPAIVSPAATEYSNAPSLQQAPSLISDNQSHYSISPKTVSSPRPGMPAPIDTSTQDWAKVQRRNSFGGLAQDNRPRHADEGYVSAIPPSAVSDSQYRHMTLETTAHRTMCNLASKTPTNGQFSPSSSSPVAGRDNRMTLSRLLD